MTMKIIGLCGISGSGKGTVSEYFKSVGIPVIDTDLVYRELTDGESECLSELCAEFGNGILSESGSLDRRALSQIVFFGDGCETRRQRLNSIAHKHILNETRRRLREYANLGVELAVVDAPLLFESGFDKECDLVVGVLADRDACIKRICSRDGLTLEQAQGRIDSQLTSEQIRSRSNFVIWNNSTTDALMSAAAELLNKIKLETK